MFLTGTVSYYVFGEGFSALMLQHFGMECNNNPWTGFRLELVWLSEWQKLHTLHKVGSPRQTPNMHVTNIYLNPEAKDSHSRPVMEK